MTAADQPQPAQPQAWNAPCQCVQCSFESAHGQESGGGETHFESFHCSCQNRLAALTQRAEDAERERDRQAAAYGERLSEADLRCGQTQERLEEVRADNQRLQAVVEAVRVLHVPRNYAMSKKQYCYGCTYPWPCQTIAALDSTVTAHRSHPGSPPHNDSLEDLYREVQP